MCCIKDLIWSQKTKCIIPELCPLESQEAACLEATRSTRIKIKPPSPKDMDDLRLCVISAIEVITRLVSYNMEDSQNVSVEVWVSCSIRCKHHDVRMRARVDGVLVLAHIIAGVVDAKDAVLVHLVSFNVHVKDIIICWNVMWQEHISTGQAMEEVGLQLVFKVLRATINGKAKR